MYGSTRNYGDITQIERLDYADLWTYSFPCTDISLAGEQKGIRHKDKVINELPLFDEEETEEETRSGLLYEVKRLLDVSKINNELPKCLLLENVSALVNKKNIRDFQTWLDILAVDYGYNNYWKLLNAKDYEIPQNRNRVFAVSIRKGIDKGSFHFPQPMELKTRLKDFLEDEVDEKYYLSDKQIDQIKNWKGYQNRLDRPLVSYATSSREQAQQGWKDICPTLTARDYKDPKIVIKPICHNSKTTKAGSRPTDNFIEVFDFRYDEGVRGRADNNLSPTITTKAGSKGFSGQPLLKITEATKQKNGLCIRKLTPKECWRLMGFTDDDFDKASAVNSNSQLYKQAGNSIVVQVLEGIFQQLKEMEI
jgi:DNA (cytosine-5)-methyltransferase 1